jgi:hypothetical protein
VVQQFLHHAVMEVDQSGAAAEQQRGTAVAVAGAAEEVDFLRPGDFRVRTAVDEFQRGGDGADIVLDQQLGAGAGLAVEHRPAHAAHVSVHALVERVEQLGGGVRGQPAAQFFVAAADFGMIVERGFLGLPPVCCAGQRIVLQRERLPVVIAGGAGHGQVQVLERGGGEGGGGHAGPHTEAA